jgi:hypothetical protein
MSRIVIRGRALVFRGTERVVDPAVLQSLDGVVYDDEVFTDYLGGPPEEDALAAALLPGGNLRFSYVIGEAVLSLTTEYQSRRPLADAELRLLTAYTLGQWADGIGENWTCESEGRVGYGIMCVSPEHTDPSYPVLDVIEDPPG